MGNYNHSSMNRMQGNMSRNFVSRDMAKHHCGCSTHFSDTYNDEFPVGMTYVPWQKWKDIYEPDKALHHGTIFAELDKPFYRMRGVKR